MSVTKPVQIRIRIADEDMPIIIALAGRVLSVTDVASLLLSGAVEAVKNNSGEVAFPPKFNVDNSPRVDLQLNEKPVKSRR